MKHVPEKKPSAVRITQMALTGVLILLALAILTGTIYALVSPPKQTSPGNSPGPDPALQGGGNTFTGIGRIRTSTAGDTPAAVIITIAFPYNPEDKTFSEELASKVAKFRSETNQYFNSLTPDELRMISDDDLRKDLLALFNAQLRLGSIETLYIHDYMVVE